MDREVALRNGNFGLVRREIGSLLTAAIRLLSQIARRMGYPALASVPVSAVMLSRLETISPQQALEDVAQLFVGGRFAQLPVVDRGTPVGVITRDDVAVGLARGGPHASVAEAPRHDVVMVAPSDSLVEVLARLRESPDTVAVVVDRGNPVGLLTFASLVAYVEGAKAA